MHPDGPGLPRRAACAVSIAVCLIAASVGAASQLPVPLLAAPAAEPIVNLGIGTSNCTKLAADIHPAEGLGNPVNVMLYAWVQGYVSAANVALLEQDSKHVDLNGLDEAKVLALVASFCKANPNKKPVAAIDEMIRKSPKLKTKWEPGTIDWDE